MRIRLVVNAHGTSTGEIVCEAPDTGAFTIPADTVTELMDRGLSGFPSIEVARRSLDNTTIESGCVELAVASTVIDLTVQVEGLISCEEDDECPDGQTCSDDTLMCI